MKIRVALLALLALMVSGCGLSHFSQGQWNSGDGQVQAIGVPDRKDAVEFSGTTLEGKPFDVASTRGKVTVVNVWGAWCADCIQEAGDIQAAHRQLGSGVPFVGIDIRDTSRDTALAYQRGNHITYPSIYAADPSALAAFDASAGISAETVPATLILDQQGRVATVIRGKIPSTLTLVEAVRDVEHGTHGA